MTSILPNVPTTKLGAVNICLSAMGEPAVNSLDDAAIDAQSAANIVDETTASVQSEGWDWNTEKHTLSPNTDGFILLPENTIRVDTIEEDAGTDVIQRGLKLFDRKTSSYSFTKPLRLELIVILPFEEVPFSAKQFIAIRAARIFQQRSLGSDTLYKYDAADEQRAWAVLVQEEADTLDANVLRDNWSTASIVNRTFFARGAYR
jgi:hypothetical protein